MNIKTVYFFLILTFKIKATERLHEPPYKTAQTNSSIGNFKKLIPHRLSHDHKEGMFGQIFMMASNIKNQITKNETIPISKSHKYEGFIIITMALHKTITIKGIKYPFIPVKIVIKTTAKIPKTAQ